IDFAHLWASLQYTLAQPDCRPDRFASTETVFDHGRKFGDWLLRAAIARCVVAAYLLTGRRRHPTLGVYLHLEVGPPVRARNGVLVERAFRTALNELHDGQLAAISPTWSDLWPVYRDLYDDLAHDAANLGSLGRIDPVGGLLGWQDGDPEMPESW